jgi:hypothetical protein
MTILTAAAMEMRMITVLIIIYYGVQQWQKSQLNSQPNH